MTKIISSLFILHLCFIVPLFSQNFIWANGNGSNGNDAGSQLIKGNDGFIYVAGSFQNSISLGTINLVSSGSSDFFLAKVDPADGHYIWVKQGGSAGADQITCLIFNAAGNLCFGGYANGDVMFGNQTPPTYGNEDGFVFVTDTAGNALDAISIGGTQADRVKGICKDGNGIAIVGEFQGTTHCGTLQATSTGGNNDYDIFLIPYINNTPSWIQSYGSAISIDQVFGVCKQANDYAIAATFTNTINFGATQLTNGGADDVYYGLTTSTGAAILGMKISGPAEEYTVGIGTDALNNAYLIFGFTQTCTVGNNAISSPGGANDLEIGIVKMSSAGNVVWVKYSGGLDDIIAKSCNVTSDGTTFVTGSFAGNVSFDGLTLAASTGNYVDMYCASYKSDGTSFCAFKGGGINADETGFDIWATSSDDIYLTGNYSANTNLGTVSLNSYGQADFFVARLGFQSAIVENNKKPVLLFPIPAIDFLNLIFESDQKKLLIIKDDFGRTVLKQNITGDSVKIKIDFLINGHYTVEIFSDNLKCNAEFVKQSN